MNKPSSEFAAEIGKKYAVGNSTVMIEEVLAEGGYGVVFLARNSAGQKFALKRVYVNEEHKLQTLRREIQIMKSLSSHKNIVTFVDSSISKNHKGVWEVLMLMQYYAGNCISMLNARGAAGFTEPEVLKIFCDICEAVSRLHHCKTPILHRDLKIENVLFEGTNTFVLCDFGSATAQFYIPGQSDRSISDIEEDINKHTTLSHRAPEMVNLYSDKPINTKADIWALGVTLYRLCFRSLPFGESTLAIQTANLTFPENAKHSKGLLALISFCLNPDPVTRPNIWQVCHVAFAVAGRRNPVNNIENAPIPDIDKLVEEMMNRTPRSNRSNTPRAAERGERIETTSVTPRERPKAARNASLAARTPPVARQLVSGAVSIASPQPQLVQAQPQVQMQNRGGQVQAPANPQAQPAQPSNPATFSFESLSPEQQQQLLVQRQQLLQQQEYYKQQQLKLQQQQYMEQEAHRQKLIYQQQMAIQQQALQEQQLQQQLIQQQMQQHALQEQQQQILQQQLYQEQLLQQEQLKKQQEQVLMDQYIAYQTQQQLLLRQTNSNAVNQVFIENNSQPQPSFAPQDVQNQPVPPVQDSKSVAIEHKFDDDFSQTVMFEADFSNADFSQATADSPVENKPPEIYVEADNNTVEVATEQTDDEEFKIPPVPQRRKSDTEPLTPADDTKSHKKTHRRNASDTSAISVGRSSAFRLYNPSKGAKLTVSLYSLNEISNQSSMTRPKSADNSLSDFSVGQTKSASVENLHHWNPFADDTDDTISDDVTFGQEFDRLRTRGSQSSIQNVKSREDLVMFDSDPFANAPFPAINKKGKPARREQRQAERYSRLDSEPTQRSAPNQTLFGVPIPFMKKGSNEKYHKVPNDSDNESRDNGSSDEDLLDKTLNAGTFPQSQPGPSTAESKSNSNTLTRQNQSIPGRPDSCCDDSSTLSPSASSSENVTADPFNAAPFLPLSNSVKLEDGTVSLLPSNPFLNGIMADQSNASNKTPATGPVVPENHQIPLPLTAKARDPSSSGFAAIRTVETTEKIAVENFLPSDERLFMSKPLKDQALFTLPRMTKSKTTESISEPLEGMPDPALSAMKRSQTDYDVQVRSSLTRDSPAADMDNDDTSDSEILLADSKTSNTNSLKKDKDRKSPRAKVNSKSPRSSSRQKGRIAGEIEEGGADGYEGGPLTNEAFSERDPSPSQELNDTLPTVKVPPPVAPKPQIVPSVRPKTTIGPSTPVQSQNKFVSSSETKPSVVDKDPYKTHKRYSSYDIATGRVINVQANDNMDESKSSLMGRKDKTKKKNRIGLSLFQ